MSDLEVVVMSLTAEFMSIDSENSLFKEINRQQIPNLIERSKHQKEPIKMSISHNPISLENQEKELNCGAHHEYLKNNKMSKHYFHNCVTSSESETIMPKLLKAFKTRILAKRTALTLVQYINKIIFDRPISTIKNQTI